jgi:DNA-binding GntR family transcriptional regulator
MQTHAVGTANLIEWARLDLKDLPAPVLRATLVRYDDGGSAVKVEYVVLPLDRFPGLVANTGDLFDIVDLARRHGLSLGGASERIRIVAASGDIARTLRVAPGTSVLKRDRVTDSAEGEPLEWRIAYSRT